MKIRRKISVKSSLGLAAVAVGIQLVPIPIVGGLAFWILLAAYGFLFWAAVLR